MPPAIKEAYNKGITALLSLPMRTDTKGKPTAHVLRLSAAAETKLYYFESWREPQLRPGAELGDIVDWGGKLTGTVARIAGILHMAEHAGGKAPWSIPISAEIVERAVSLAKEYLIPHAQAAYAEMGANPNVQAAKCVLDWIRRMGREKFSKRDLFNGAVVLRCSRSHIAALAWESAGSAITVHLLVMVDSFPGGVEKGCKTVFDIELFKTRINRIFLCNHDPFL